MSDVRVKIYGAGSAGTHFTRAALERGWSVDIVDVNFDAFKRMANLYQSRYFVKLDNVGMFELGGEPRGGYDIVIVASPPETHVPLWKQIVEEDPRALLIEKPLCPPNAINEAAILMKHDIPMYCGYTHIMTVDPFYMAPDVSYYLACEFREDWSFVLKAHPWMKGPEDSYLGDWRRGGGALGEHSHGINMWQHVARQNERGEVARVSAIVNYTDKYDSFANLSLETDTGFRGTVILDTESNPAVKQLTMTSSHSDRGHTLHIQKFGKSAFGAELDHIQSRVTHASSPINVKYGYLTARVIAAAHESGQNGGKWVDV